MELDLKTYREKFEYILNNVTLSLNEISVYIGISAYLLRDFRKGREEFRRKNLVQIKVWIDKKYEQLKQEEK